MLSHLFRAIFRATDRGVEDMVAAALEVDDLSARVDAFLAVPLPEINPGHEIAAAAFADFDAAWDCPIFDEVSTDRALAAVIDAMHGVDDFLWLCGEDA